MEVGDSPSTIRNALMLVTVCGSLPAVVALLLKHMRVREEWLHSGVACACLLVVVPLLLSLFSASIGIYSCKAAGVVLSFACGILFIIGVVIFGFWAILEVITRYGGGQRASGQGGG